MAKNSKGKIVIEIIKNKCIGCSNCIPVCPVDALAMKDGIAEVDIEKCIGCGKCVSVCPTNAIIIEKVIKKELQNEAVISAQKSNIAAYKGIWVFVEQEHGVPHPVSWELIGEARRLAPKLGATVSAVILGGKKEDLEVFAREAIHFGADSAYIAASESLLEYRTKAYADGLVQIVNKYKPEILLIGATTLGRDLAGAVATRLKAGLTADCTGLEINTENLFLEMTRPTFGGNVMATIFCENVRPQMATVRPHVMPMPKKDAGRAGKIIFDALNLPESEIDTKVIEFIVDAACSDSGLHYAEVIVSGGRGMGKAENFSVLRELASVLCGAVGASRAAVDAGWVDHSYQIGQTGVTVRPRLYIACGISGSIQHRMGMQCSDCIVAINTDKNAPIFDIATYGIVTDAVKFVPVLTKIFREKLAGKNTLVGIEK